VIEGLVKALKLDRGSHESCGYCSRGEVVSSLGGEW
jgi:hypothetical protein